MPSQRVAFSSVLPADNAAARDEDGGEQDGGGEEKEEEGIDVARDAAAGRESGLVEECAKTGQLAEGELATTTPPSSSSCSPPTSAL